MARSLRRNHQHIYEALRAAGRPMSAYQVLDSVREHGISTAPTVYRALDYLVGKGQVHRLETMNAYVACSDPGHVHDVPVFAICTTCRGTEELTGVGVLKVLERQAEEAGFAIDRATVEIEGRCATCRAGDPAKPMA